MRYEHLVQINDLGQPGVPVLERAALWTGLLARAERPALFDATIDATHELRRDGNRLLREVVRGTSVTQESMALRALESIEISIGGGSGFAGSALTIAIEEPAPLAFFLRFTYELRGAQAPAEEPERCALRAAYYHANLDLVRRVRALAAAAVEVAATGTAAVQRPRAAHGGGR